MRTKVAHLVNKGSDFCPTPGLVGICRWDFGSQGRVPKALCRRSDAWCRRSDAWCRRSDAWCRRSDAGCRMPGAEGQRPDAGCRMPDAWCRRSEAGCRMPDAVCRLSGRPSSGPTSATRPKRGSRGRGVPRFREIERYCARAPSFGSRRGARGPPPGVAGPAACPGEATAQMAPGGRLDIAVCAMILNHTCISIDRSNEN